MKCLSAVLYMNLVQRVAARYAAAILPFKPKPGVPTITIHGRKYVLSTDGGPLMLDMGAEDDDAAGGARLIRGPEPTNKWKYLWAYDTEKQYLAMWRVTDGNDKVRGPARAQTTQILQLEKRGQLNRATTAEFRQIETAMDRLADDVLRERQDSLAQDQSAFERDVEAVVHEFYQTRAKPKIDRAVQDVLKGAIPLGFKPFDHPHQNPTEQAVNYVVGKTYNQEMRLDKVHTYLRTKGLDVEAPGQDSQAAYWVVQSLAEKVYEEYED